MIYALVEYINRNGKTSIKGFSTKEDLDQFVDNLDKRIEKGTCGGYLVTVTNKEVHITLTGNNFVY